MSTQKELRLSGSGGQGMILAGIILAEAAIREGKNAIQSQSYGPEARGGASKAEVLISTEDINFPKVQCPDLVLAITTEAAEKYAEVSKEDALIVVDSTVKLPDNITTGKIVSVPILQTAKEKIGKSIVANIIALGVIVELTGVVSKEAIEAAVLSRVPKGTEELNRAALQEGYELAMNTNI